MFQLYVDKSKLTIQQQEPLISGSVNTCSMHFWFSSSWTGLTRTAVFRTGEVVRSVLLDTTNACCIPWEVLAQPLPPSAHLYVGVYGTRGEDIVLPTIWADCGVIHPGAAPGKNSRPPTPDVYQQILAETQMTREATAKNCMEAAAAVSSAEQAAKRAEAVSLNPPRLSENSTWMVWDVNADSYRDTGSSAIGPEGKQGEIGPQGIQGERGEQGPRGFPGTEVVIHETYGPSPLVTVDMAIPGTPLHPVSEIKLVQEGEGTPSLENMRNIKGWNKITLTHNGYVYGATLPEMVYGGTYDWVRGELTVTHKLFELNVEDMCNSDDYPGWRDLSELTECFELGTSGTATDSLLNIGTKISVNLLGNNRIVYFRKSDYNMSQAEWKERYPDLHAQVAFPLIVPRKIHLSPQEFISCPGDGILTSNCGDTSVTFQVNLKKYVDKQILSIVKDTMSN